MHKICTICSKIAHTCGQSMHHCICYLPYIRLNNSGSIEQIIFKMLPLPVCSIKNFLFCRGLSEADFVTLSHFFLKGAIICLSFGSFLFTSELLANFSLCNKLAAIRKKALKLSSVVLCMKCFISAGDFNCFIIRAKFTDCCKLLLLFLTIFQITFPALCFHILHQYDTY